MATPNYLKANCPKCKNKIEFLEKDINETLHCDSCGIDFRYEQSEQCSKCGGKVHPISGDIVHAIGCLYY